MSGPAAAQAADTNWSYVLATDLDGTFLGGTEADRAALYAAIEARRGEMGLIFVTGRDPDFIESLCGDGFVPWPDMVIGDVGTTIATVESRRIRPLPALEVPIAEAWADSGPRVRAALTDAKGLTLQPQPFRHRVSYDLDMAAYDGAAELIVQDMGLDWLISADRFFDVLPPGISKGPSLARLVDHIGLPRDRVLAAGDTLNDFSMLAVGLPAVAVGGSEPALLAKLQGMDHVHRARGVGAAGIAEALTRLGFDDFMKGIAHAV